MTIIENLCVTKKQYDELRKLGYNNPFRAISWVEDWLLRKHGLVIESWPFAPRIDGKDKYAWRCILRRFDTKKDRIVCAGYSKTGYNPNALKRQCINQAIKYLKQNVH